MPAWITSLLRDDVTVPIPSVASRMMTSRPACASRRATARPITPAPTTTHSTFSISQFESGLGLLILDPAQVNPPRLRDQSHSRLIGLFWTIFSRKAPDFPQAISDPGFPLEKH